jgi:hypothetical protein
MKARLECAAAASSMVVENPDRKAEACAEASRTVRGIPQADGYSQAIAARPETARTAPSGSEGGNAPGVVLSRPLSARLFAEQSDSGRGPGGRAPLYRQ